MKLPPEAKLKFKGIIFDTYQWQQKMFDGSFATFEMLKRPDTVQIIPTDGKHIYIAEEEQPLHPLCFTLLGGRCEQGEEPIQAAKRELLEEAGMTSSDWEALLSTQPYTKMEWSVHTFIARDCHFTKKPELDAGEKITLKKVTFDEFVQIVISEKYWGREFANYILLMLYNNQRGVREFKNKLGLN